jgi:hypothetical protein
MKPVKLTIIMPRRIEAWCIWSRVRSVLGDRLAPIRHFLFLDLRNLP